jgi:hypothetical protein
MATCWPGRRHERTAWLAGMGANTTAPVIVRTVTGSVSSKTVPRDSLALGRYLSSSRTGAVSGGEPATVGTLSQDGLSVPPV